MQPDELALIAALSREIESGREIRDESFKAQDAFVMDPSRFIVAQCSRRAGKTNGLAIKFFRAMDSHPGSLCLYIALTRESARIHHVANLGGSE